jgi:hypothetical protein
MPLFNRYLFSCSGQISTSKLYITTGYLRGENNHNYDKKRKIIQKIRY